MLRSIVLLLLLAPLVSAAPVPKELKRGGDDQAILGTWDMVLHSNGGGPPTPQAVKWELGKDGQAFIINPNRIAITYKLHQATSPKSFDWNWPGASHMGLYELKGDTLKVVIMSAGGAARPTELKPAEGAIYCEFQRVAPGTK